MRLVLPKRRTNSGGPRSGGPALPGPEKTVEGPPSASPKLTLAQLNQERYAWEESIKGLRCRLVEHPARVVGAVIYGAGMWHWWWHKLRDGSASASQAGAGQSYYKHEAQRSVEAAHDAWMAAQVERALEKEEDL